MVEAGAITRGVRMSRGATLRGDRSVPVLVPVLYNIQVLKLYLCWYQTSAFFKKHKINRTLAEPVWLRQVQ